MRRLPCARCGDEIAELQPAQSSHFFDQSERIIGAVLIAGGRNDGGPLEGAELYELGTEDGGRIVGRFRTTGSMTAPGYAHAATAFSDDGAGRVLITGGIDTAGPLDTAELYDPATGSFGAAGRMTTARQGHTAPFTPTAASSSGRRRPPGHPPDGRAL